jgi:DNA-directed RNA polymerase subunit beta'
VVTDSPDDKQQPQIVVRPEGAGGSRSEAKKYPMPTHARLMMRDGEQVYAGYLSRRSGSRRRRPRASPRSGGCPAPRVVRGARRASRVRRRFVAEINVERSTRPLPPGRSTHRTRTIQDEAPRHRSRSVYR